MSVINKVLRDLDNRSASPQQPFGEGSAAASREPLPTGVVAVPPLPVVALHPPPRRGWPWGMLLLIPLLGGLAAIGWWWQGSAGADAVSQSGPQKPVAVPVPPVPSVAAAPVGQLVAAPVITPADAPAAAASEALFPPGVARPEALASLPLPAPVAPPAAAVVLPAGGPGVPASTVASVAPPAARLVPPAPAGAASTAARVAAVAPVAPVAPAAPKPAVEMPPVAIPAPVPWPDAALEAVGQAQRMWGSGARDTALAFLRDALGGMERAHGSDLAPERPGASAGLAMVRELVRMEQVMGNHAQVLALLKRHEALAARQADLWAVRGSAAQRLTQHAEAADAYRTALRLRPGEPRWMLAAAVSLAALGNVADAGQLVEQARASGPVNPEVLSYLRQLGVQVRGDNQGN